MVKPWAKDYLSFLINRQVTPGLTFIDYRNRVHRLSTEEPDRLDSAMPERGSPRQQQSKRSLHAAQSMYRPAESGPSGRQNAVRSTYASSIISHGTRRAMSEPSILANDDDHDDDDLLFPKEDLSWSADRLVDFRIGDDGLKWQVRWQSAIVKQHYIQGINEEEQYIIIDNAEREKWVIKRILDRSNTRTGEVRVLWEDSWLPDATIRSAGGFEHLMYKLKQAGPPAMFAMADSEKKRYKEKYHKNEHWVAVKPGQDIYAVVKELLQDSNRLNKPKTQELLTSEQKRAVLFHGHRFDKNPWLRRFLLKPTHMHAVLLQATGRPAERPCKICREDNGTFIGGCIVSPKQYEWFNGACVCCHVVGKSTSCDHHKNKADAGDDDNIAVHRTRPSQRIRYEESSSDEEEWEAEHNDGWGPKTPAPMTPPPSSPHAGKLTRTPSIKSSPGTPAVKPSSSPPPSRLSAIPRYAESPSPTMDVEDVALTFDRGFSEVCQMAADEDAATAVVRTSPRAGGTPSFLTVNTQREELSQSRAQQASQVSSKYIFVTPSLSPGRSPSSLQPVVSAVATGRGSARPQQSRSNGRTASPLASKMLPPPRPAARSSVDVASRAYTNLSLKPPPMYSHPQQALQRKHHKPRPSTGKTPPAVDDGESSKASRMKEIHSLSTGKLHARRDSTLYSSSPSLPIRQQGKTQETSKHCTVRTEAVSQTGFSASCSTCHRQFNVAAHHIDRRTGSVRCTKCSKSNVVEDRQHDSVRVALKQKSTSPRRSPHTGSTPGPSKASRMTLDWTTSDQNQHNGKRYSEEEPDQRQRKKRRRDRKRSCSTEHADSPANKHHSHKNKLSNNQNSYSPSPSRQHQQKTSTPRHFVKSRGVGFLNDLPVYALLSP